MLTLRLDLNKDLDDTLKKHSLVHDFVIAALDGVKEAILETHQDSWKKVVPPTQDEFDRLLGVSAYKMYQNPIVNNEKTRMEFRGVLGKPTKVIGATGKTVAQMRGQEKNNRAYRNRLEINESNEKVDRRAIEMCSDSDDEVIVVKKTNKKDPSSLPTF